MSAPIFDMLMGDFDATFNFFHPMHSTKKKCAMCSADAEDGEDYCADCASDLKVEIAMSHD